MHSHVSVSSQAASERLHWASLNAAQRFKLASDVKKQFPLSTVFDILIRKPTMPVFFVPNNTSASTLS
jgi:hypothetical protein